MNSNKSRFCRGNGNSRSCYGCRHNNKGTNSCKINMEIECAIDGNYKFWEANIKTCKKCVWSTDVGGKLFCLFTNGTCMYNDPVFRNANKKRQKG